MKRSEALTAEGILFTDQYQLAMAQLYYRTGLHEREAQFDYLFRKYPDFGSHKAGYCISAGLEWLLDWMKEGALRYECPSIEAMRKTRVADLDRPDSGVKRLINPHIYHVSLTKKL